MPKAKPKNSTRHELEALVEKALSEAGVAEAVEVYEKSEAVYTEMSATSPPPVTYAASSTSGMLQTRPG